MLFEGHLKQTNKKRTANAVPGLRYGGELGI